MTVSAFCEVTDDVEADARLIRPICASIAQNGGASFLALAGIDVDVPATVEGVYPDLVHAEDWDTAVEICSAWGAGGDDVLAPGMAPAVPAAQVWPDGTAFVLFTSGATGAVRGVRCPHAQTVWWGRDVSDSLRLTADDVLYTCLPLFHTNALNTLAHAMAVGASCVIDERFSASRYWGRVAQAGAAVVHLLGAMVPVLLAQPPGPADRAHRARRGLSPATSGSAWEPFRERFGVTLVDGCGSTETNLVIGSTPEEQRPGYVGTVREGFAARVVDELLDPVPDGVPGELLVRSAHRFAFCTLYLGEPEPGPRVAAHRRPVVREPDGWFRFVDRTKDVIRRRGEKVSSYEVESAVRAHPAVADAAAFPVPSELAEDEVMVAVVPVPGQVLDLRNLVRHCAQELPPFAVPRTSTPSVSFRSPGPAKSARQHCGNVASPPPPGTAPNRPPRDDIKLELFVFLNHSCLWL
ncbi:AMP-binding protein [Streptomyces sp. NPDC050549]|uniref:AMP-binding protein n=1 Tax=Streptomyces sp. NPDC050549 TaxID=3155406 RepID=UPI0034483954